MFFEYSEQLDLRAHGHVTDFVEEQSASVGVLERTHTIAGRIGKGTFDVAK